VNSEIAVFDAGPLIAFHQINRLELLRDLFGRVVAPPAVAQEVAPSLGTLPHWIEEQAIFKLPPFSRSLGAGERAAIALTIELHAEFVVLDDWDARSSAIELGLRVIGSLGLLVRAKESGLIGEVRPSGFRNGMTLAA
jgi:uncharacterized protein